VQEGYGGLKPGWCRIGFHYTMDDIEANYVIEAVRFVATFGHRFLQLYDFDIGSGAWSHKDDYPQFDTLSIESAMATKRLRGTAVPAGRRQSLYRSYLADARRRARALADTPGSDRLIDGMDRELQFFVMDRRSAVTADQD
jgi:hypothetical protein